MGGLSTEQTWRIRVDGWRSSGLTAPAFCEGKEFAPSALRYWASRLRRAQPAKDVRLARVVREGDADALDTPIVVEVGAARVGIRRGFDRDVLRAVLEVLGAAR